MLKNMWLNHRHRRNRKSWIWRAKHRKEKDNWFFHFLDVFYMYILSFFRHLFRFIFLVLVLCILAGVWFYNVKLMPLYQKYKDDTDEILANTNEYDFKISEGSIIYDKDGKVIANLYDTANNEYISYEDIPEDVVNAFVAIEDRTFWTNTGIDTKGIARVLYNYVKSSGDEAHGASTITQQLARNVYLTQEVSMERKLKEMLISLKLTKIYTKEQIMEFYCNDICFANGIYGIQSAAHAYFNKDVQDLTTSEIAYLCAIPNRPEYYNPYNDSTRALERRDKILADMNELGYITDAELETALAETITIEKPEYVFNDYETTYAIDCAVKYLMRLDGFEFQYAFDTDEAYDTYHENYDYQYQIEKDKLYHGGYKIYTSLDTELYSDLQTILDDTLSFNTETDEETGVYALQGALTVVDNNTHKVVALVGGRSQEDNTYVYSLNRAYQSYRQPGSTFKPIAVYTPALQLGYTANSMLQNIDVKKAAEKGVNVQELTGTQMTMRSAVEQSQNGCAWQLFDKITPTYGMSFITNMRFSGLCKDDYYDSAALGGLTYGVTTAEMAAAYSTLANHGEYYENTCLVSILDDEGNELYIEEDGIQIYDEKAADDMVDILKGVLVRGTAAGLSWSSSSKTEAFCKTGTTNSSKDGWLCGATPYYSISVWVGFDTPRAMSSLYGSTYPGQIWKKSMLRCIEGLDTASFERAEYKTNEGMDSSTQTATGYYSYLEGRDDNEVLSSGYTVGDYRADRVIGESVYAVIDEINACTDLTKLEELRTKGYNIIDTIYSINFTSEMTANLETAYNTKKKELGGY